MRSIQQWCCLLAGLGAVAFLSGCQHALEVKNISDYRSLTIATPRDVHSIGIVPSTTDIHGERLVKSAGTKLATYLDEVLLPYSTRSSRKVDVIASIKVAPNYKGSGLNFLINWPGFLIFTPAWNGYIYKVRYDVDIALTNAADGGNIGTFSLPIDLHVRHAAMNRTWTEVGWLEWGVIPLVSGIFFTSYDKKVTSILLDHVGDDIGEYIAQEILSRLDASGVARSPTTSPGN